MELFQIKTMVGFGSHVLGYLDKLKDKKVFLVTDPFMIQSKMADEITKHLQKGKYQIFSEIVPDPPIELVVKGVALVTEYKPSAVIALGGGSAIDAAKAILHFAKAIGSLHDVEFIAIPTTSGTGSEVTKFAVITDQKKGMKYPLVSDELVPDTALLVPELVKSVPPSIVADTGIDVLTHAIEAYVSTAATDFTDALAEKAVILVFQYLRRSYQNAEDIEAKEKMHNASCIAGMAFNEASLGLNHALAHSIGGKLHIPHGRTNAVLLPHVIEFNGQLKGYSCENCTHTAQKYAQLAKIAGFSGSNTSMSVRNLINQIKKLEKELHMPFSLQECGVELKKVKELSSDIAKSAISDICMKTNPIRITETELIELIHKVI